MANPSAHVLELAKRGAVLRFRELANEVELLLQLFPDLRDSFDPDELPVSFIVRRDATDAGAAEVTQSHPGGVRRTVNRKVKQSWTRRRAGSKT